MKKILLVVVGVTMGLQVLVADPMVSGGAYSGRLGHAIDEVGVRIAIAGGQKAGGILADWSDQACQATFGVSGQEVFDKAFKAVLITALTYGVYRAGKYVVCREPNDQKVKRALSIWKRMNVELGKITTLEDIQMFIYNFKHLEQYVLQSYKELSARYGSWIKPWNWTAGMKEAYEKMQLVSILFKYQETLTMTYEYSEEYLLKIATADYSLTTAYPICAYVEALQMDIAAMQYLSTKSSYAFASIISQQLNKILRVIAASSTYISERRLLQDAIARERLVNAIDRQF